VDFKKLLIKWIKLLQTSEINSKKLVLDEMKVILEEMSD
jgi:hypothetical protein